MENIDSKPTLLLVDDTPDNITLLCSLLGGQYRNKVATNGQKALKIAFAEPHPDLILLDIMMPEMDGYEVCRQLKANPATKDIPVIFLTAKNQEDDETKGFELGAVDYITKPISPPILLARVHTQLTLKDARSFLERQNEILEKQVDQRTQQLASLQDVIIIAMASLAETRDNETGFHIRRTQNYVREMAAHLQEHPRFSAYLDKKTVELLKKSAPLHDIGKVGVPDRILLKPGKLTEEEFEIMKKHTIYGHNTILEAENNLGSPESFLSIAREIAYSHHEKWDGSGYPQGLKGDEIPISARLMAIADVYDALMSKRVYKEAMSHEQAKEIIVNGKGTHFDPDVVDAFIAIQDKFSLIAVEFADEVQ
ncbi:response regulator [Desulfovibrio litoralis]|uniref:Putative two-component system response regulator n=1 Tax=Desulfovibrio litoralis DSM 11393 TaxID=1121455 RepID=A0A1M7SMM0_9BACT|nr:two-component system response regulator [Desulfovibrio litoralis]SHN59674.1 putative two-component system response regulator [Desulfovibrio litoralis DSM 11393]